MTIWLIAAVILLFAVNQKLGVVALCGVVLFMFWEIALLVLAAYLVWRYRFELYVLYRQLQARCAR